MKKVISTTWPWDHNKLTVDQTIAKLKDLGADTVCIRTPYYYTPYNPIWHKELAIKAKTENIAVALWPVVSLFDPVKQAQVIKSEYNVYKPSIIVLDAERSWVLDYISNLGKFLETLGKMPCPVGLGSYRRASSHKGMNWQGWYTAKDGNDYIINFLGHQLYPIGWTTPEQWVAQFKLDIDSHEVELAKANRPDMPWLPWMPSFVGGGFEGLATPWVPRADSAKAAVEYTTAKLGNRLIGFNWWSLDKNLVDTSLTPLYAYIKTLPSSVISPTPLPLPVPIEPTDDEKLDILWREAKKHPELFDLTP